MNDQCVRCDTALTSPWVTGTPLSPSTPSVADAACGRGCTPRWRLPWVPIIRPAVLGFWALFFGVIAVVDRADGGEDWWIGLFLAVLLGAPAIWIGVHPFLVRRRMRKGSEVPVTVWALVPHLSELGFFSFLTPGQPVKLELTALDGQHLLAEARHGSDCGGHGVQLRGNPWLEAGPSERAVPGGLLMPSRRTGRPGLVLHRPVGATHEPLESTWARELLNFGSDPGLCIGLYLRRNLRPVDDQGFAQPPGAPGRRSIGVL